MTTAIKEEKSRCKEIIYSSGFFRRHRCSRYEWKDGYCKQHHPETKKTRDDALRKKYEEDATNKRAILERKKKKNESISRILMAVNKVALNSTIPSSGEHNRFAFVLLEDFTELVDAFQDYEDIE